MDIIAATDQAVENAKQTARILSAFYNKLSSEGVPHETAHELSIMYAKRILTGKPA